MNFDKRGLLVINATSAGGALPTGKVVVRIQGADEENRDVRYSLLTDLDGVSPKIALPAPNRDLSMSPKPTAQPYANYNIEIYADGFYAKRIFNVAVFDGEETVQPVNMIPYKIHERGVTYPRNTLDTFVRENEMLE